MLGYISIAIIFVGILYGLRIVRKETSEQTGISKKGMLQLGILLTIVFFAVVTVVFITQIS